MTADCAGECVQPPPLSGPPTHTIIDLGTLGGLEANALALNNQGQVVGEADTTEGRRHAFLWENGTITDLTPDAGTWWTTGRDVNNRGEVIINTAPERAFVWRQGLLFELRTPYPIARSYGTANNDLGQVVGWALVAPSTVHVVQWDREGAVTDIYETLGLGEANDINSVGHIATAVADGRNVSAAISKNGLLVNIGSLGGQLAWASAINDADQVVGASERFPGGNRIFYGFLWENSDMIDLDSVTGHSPTQTSGGYTLNNCGEVLLDGDGPSRGTDYFLYQRDGSLRSVRGLTHPHTEWAWLSPNAIKDRGQIVGYGLKDGLYQAFLISPIAGDLDGEGDTDLADYAEFQTRFTGSLSPEVPGCERADLDADGDVDLADSEFWRKASTGPQ